MSTAERSNFSKHLGDVGPTFQSYKPSGGTKEHTLPSESKLESSKLNRTKSHDSLISKGSKDSYDQASYELEEATTEMAILNVAAKTGIPVKPSRTMSSESTGFFLDEMFHLQATVPSKGAVNFGPPKRDIASHMQNFMLDRIMDEPFFVKLCPSQLQLKGYFHKFEGDIVGVLTLLQLTTGKLVQLQVRYCSNHLKARTTLSTLDQLGLWPAPGKSPLDQSIVEMAGNCAAQTAPLANLRLYLDKLAKQLLQQGYPFPIDSSEQLIRIRSSTAH